VSDPRYPADLVVTAEDFHASGWKEAIGSAKNEGYLWMHSALVDAAKAAAERNEARAGKVLWLLSDATSMMLKENGVNHPFKPAFVCGDRRSYLPDDFTEADISFFAAILPDIDNPWLRSRLADILWLRVTPRNPAHALAAIDAYRRLPLTTKEWIAGAGDGWRRAARLSSLMGAGAGNRVEQIASAAHDACHAATKDDGYLALWLSELLSENRLLLKDQVRPLAEHIEALALEFRADEKHHNCRDYLQRASRLYERAGDADKAADMLSECAESWAAQADQSGSGLAAASFYENAIQTLRRIPGAKRVARGVDDRIADLRDRLSDAGQRALGEMATIVSEPFDLSPNARAAREAVIGKEPLEAMRAFTSFGQVSVESVRKSATDIVQAHPIAHLFAASVMSPDGRVVAKSPGMAPGTAESNEDNTALRHAMVEFYGNLVGIIVQARVSPAHESLLLEHRFHEGDFRAMASHSPIVPADRVELFARGLHAGYERDFVTAIHLLAPQVEHMVRYHLKEAGAKTTTLSPQGIETENGLSTLVEMPQMEQVFGPDTTFEIRTLFCDAFGPNLRNEVAHGLISYDAAHSDYSVYAWWLCLRLVFSVFWNSHRPAKTEPEPPAESSP